MLEKIQNSLKAFSHGNLTENALKLFQTLGYESDRQQPFDNKSFADFEDYINDNDNFIYKNAFTAEWKYVDLLFQLTETELTEQFSMFDSKDVEREQFNSYLFFAVELNETKSDGKTFTRTDLANVTREINKCFPMPVFVLFKLGQNLTLSVINRRLHKKDETKDVIEIKKVSLIKDIDFTDPKRSHLEILKDLSLDELQKKHKFQNFVELHKAWMATLDTKELNKRFFRELSNWYFWAVSQVKFPKAPNDTDSDETHSAKSVIRLITRLMFVWFLKEKGLINAEIFRLRELKNILKFEDESAYYKAILQNLFFATLNTDDTDKRTPRKFRSESEGSWYKSNTGIANVYRYKSAFTNPQETLEKYFLNVPFLNGGLFECLDKPEEKIWIDGFSERKDNPLNIPDDLFFCEPCEVDLNSIYDTKNKKYEVRGLIRILDNYKFTIAENTPIEEEIALDPELLGKVFENLLANYNPETKTTARKQTGSFYTPREIVNYMVDESLIAYLKTKLQTETQGFAGFIAFGENQPTMFGNDARIQPKFEIPISENRWLGKDEELENALRQLFSYSETENQFNEIETEILIKAINDCKILDPACGSGAFPMGILQRLVFLLGKLDPNNVKWRELQRQVAVNETDEAFKIGDVKERENRLLEINEVFENNASDYGRKLFLIENCIYGVDIQPVAIQISKLRFFISLIIDQKIDDSRPNRGVRPLPNLETKLVAANTLIGLDAQRGLKPEKVHELEEKLKPVRSEIFRARTTATKTKWRERDKEIRREIADLLKQTGYAPDDANKIADWSPDNQDAHADWFDAEWMFGIEKGFDIVIGNPPWGAELKTEEKLLLKRNYPEIDSSTPNTFAYFIGKAIRLYSSSISFVLPDSILIKDFAKCRKLISPYLDKINWYQNIGIPEEQKPFVYVEHDVCVLLLSKQITENFYQSLFQYESSQKRIVQTNKVSKKSDVIRDEFDYAINLLLTETDLNILHKLKQHKSLDDFIQCHEGIHTGNSREVLFHDSKINEWCKPLFYGGGAGDKINNYVSMRSGWYVDYRKEIINKDEGFYASLRDERIFKFPKIYLTRTGNPFKAFIDEEFYASNNFFSLQFKDYNTNSIESLKVILAFIISPVAQYFIRRFAAPRLGNTFVETKIFHLLKFRVPNLNSAQQTEIAEIVDKILTLKKAETSADTSELEREIDRLVYGLYALEADEIAIIKGNAT